MAELENSKDLISVLWSGADILRSKMDANELWNYFINHENYNLKDGESMQGFMPNWIGEFYAYYQWYYNIPSAELVKKIPVSFLKKAYYGLHDLDLDLAVKKVGEV